MYNRYTRNDSGVYTRMPQPDPPPPDSRKTAHSPTARRPSRTQTPARRLLRRPYRPPLPSVRSATC